MHHCIKRTVTEGVDDVVTQVRARLEKDGFDVVCDIDAPTTLADGFDDERRYRHVDRDGITGVELGGSQMIE